MLESMAPSSTGIAIISHIESQKTWCCLKVTGQASYLCSVHQGCIPAAPGITEIFHVKGSPVSNGRKTHIPLHDNAFLTVEASAGFGGSQAPFGN